VRINRFFSALCYNYPMPEFFTYNHSEQETSNTEQGVEPNPRQQDKIVAIIDNDNLNIINEREVRLQDGEREEFLKKLASGKINEYNLRQIVYALRGPIDYIGGRGRLTNSLLSGNKYMRGFLAHFARDNVGLSGYLEFQDVVEFLERYPDPISFEGAVSNFLDGVEHTGSSQERQGYESSLRDFMHTVYGKKLEYYEQIKLLQAEAERKFPQLAEEKKRKESEVEKILAETDVNEVERLLRSELVDILEEAKRNGRLSGADFIYTPEYNRLWGLNWVVNVARGKIAQLSGFNARASLERVEQEALNQVLGEGVQQERSEKVDELREAREKIEGFQIETIKDEEVENIFEKIEVRGDDYLGEYLTPEILKKEGLLPKYKVTLGESAVWLSSSGYDAEYGRIAVVGYVENQGKITARTYYRSNSQGVWRYLPDYTMYRNGVITWFGKGYSEESVTLPIAVQRALSEITQDDASILKVKEFGLIFAGTAKKYDGQKEGEYYEQIETKPRRLDGNFYSEPGKKNPPEEIRLTTKQSPDFSRLITSWKQKTKVYGPITVEIFPSNDGTLRFMFCRDNYGRAWVGGIEDDSEVQSTGLRKSWIEGGDLATPAFEYPEQAGGYENTDLAVHPYVDMFENYLKKIPVIRQYLESKEGIHYDQENTSPEEVERKITISSAQNFTELYEALRQKGGLQGTQQFYKPEELIDIIERVRKGILDISYVTQTEGLRNRVDDIIKIEELQRKLNS